MTTPETEAPPPQPQPAAHVGEALRLARENKGMTLAEMADATRIPRRSIEAIEAGDYAALPAGPYGVGFGRAIARVVGMNEAQVAEGMRQQLALVRAPEIYTPAEFEPADANRLPPRLLVWTAVGIALALLAGYGLWIQQTRTAPERAAPAADVAAADGAPATAAASPAAPAALPADAPVLVRASGDVWFGLNDANGRLVFERTLRAGEEYALTPEQRALTLRTGRAQNLRLVVGGRELPALGAPDVLVKDIGLDAASLTQRLSAPAAATNAVTPATTP